MEVPRQEHLAAASREAARHALEAMLQRDPDRRPTMAQLLDRAYFRGGVSWRPSKLMGEMAALKAREARAKEEGERAVAALLA